MDDGKGDERAENAIYDVETNHRSVFELSETGSARSLLGGVERNIHGLLSKQCTVVQRRRHAWRLFETFASSLNNVFTVRATGAMSGILNAATTVLTNERDTACRLTMLALVFVVSDAFGGTPGSGGRNVTLPEPLVTAILHTADKSTSGATVPSLKSPGRETCGLKGCSKDEVSGETEGALSSFHRKRRRRAVPRDPSSPLVDSEQPRVLLSLCREQKPEEDDDVIATAAVMRKLRMHWPQLIAILCGEACEDDDGELGMQKKAVLGADMMTTFALLIANRLVTFHSRRLAAQANPIPNGAPSTTAFSTCVSTINGHGMSGEFRGIQEALRLELGFTAGDGRRLTTCAIMHFANCVDSDVHGVAKCIPHHASFHDGLGLGLDGEVHGRTTTRAAATRTWLWLGLLDGGCFQSEQNQTVVLTYGPAMAQLAALLAGLASVSDVDVESEGVRLNEAMPAESRAVVQSSSSSSSEFSSSPPPDCTSNPNSAGLRLSTSARRAPCRSATRLTKRMRRIFPELTATGTYVGTCVQRRAGVASAVEAEARVANMLALASGGNGSAETDEPKTLHDDMTSSATRSTCSALPSTSLSFGCNDVSMSVLRVLVTLSHHNRSASRCFQEHGILENCVKLLLSLVRSRSTGCIGPLGSVESTTSLEALFYLLTLLTNVAEMDVSVCKHLSDRVGPPILALLVRETKPFLADIEATDHGDVEHVEKDGAAAPVLDRHPHLVDRVPVGEIILSAHCALLLFTLSRAPTVDASGITDALPRKSWWLCVRMLKALVSLQGQTGVSVLDSVLPVLEVIATMEQEDPRAAGASGPTLTLVPADAEASAYD